MAPAHASTPYLEMRGISKRFGSVLASDAIDLRIEAGEIHALLGENGAGKTTLMHMLYGLMPPDAGVILLAGQPIHLRSPRHAMAHGIGMVHQHFMLVPTLTVTENIILGQEIQCGGVWLRRRRAVQHVEALCAQYHLDVDPYAKVGEVSVGVRQRVEILKALYRQVRLLILDEPTAVLTPEESEQLFQTLSALAQQGTAIIFITHKLREVYRLAQRITVLRHGRVVTTTTPAAATEAQLATWMVGHPLAPRARSCQVAAGDVVLRVREVRARDAQQVLAVQGVSLCVRAGEIVGIAGVQGNGQTTLVEVLTGLRDAVGGTVEFLGRDITRATPGERWQLGMGHIPEDRHKYGLVAGASVADNCILNTYRYPPVARGVLRRHAATLQRARQLMQAFAIRAAHAGVRAGTLSGGNQQKVVVARELSRPLRCLIAAQPTRGLDIRATAFIHQQILQQCQHGCGVLLVSTDLDEILALADRVVVFYQGRIVATVPVQEATPEQLGQWMAGL